MTENDGVIVGDNFGGVILKVTANVSNAAEGGQVRFSVAPIGDNGSPEAEFEIKDNEGVASNNLIIREAQNYDLEITTEYVDKDGNSGASTQKEIKIIHNPIKLVNINFDTTPTPVENISISTIHTPEGKGYEAFAAKWGKWTGSRFVSLDEDDNTTGKYAIKVTLQTNRKGVTFDGGFDSPLGAGSLGIECNYDVASTAINNGNLEVIVPTEIPVPTKSQESEPQEPENKG